MSHLVVIDLQRVFADADSPWAAPRFEQVLEPVARLVARYEPQVTFTRFVAPAEPVGAWRDYYAAWPFALSAPDDPQYDLVPPYTGRPTLDATTFGKWGPELAARVGGEEVVVAGVSTDCCVISTVLAAADAGVPVRVVADACAGATEPRPGAGPDGPLRAAGAGGAPWGPAAAAAIVRDVSVVKSRLRRRKRHGLSQRGGADVAAAHGAVQDA